MSKARQQANLSSDGNLFADISNDRVGVGSVVPTHKLHVNGTSKFDDDVKFEGTTAAKNIIWDKSADALKVSDNSKLHFGAGEDLSLYHLTADNDGYIKYQNENGHLKIGSGVGGNGGIQLWDRTYAKAYLTCDSDDAVKIYFNNSKKLETTNTGAKVTGNLEVTGVLTYEDVTSVDSVGIITARGVIDAQGYINLAQKIVHTGDADTSIEFPAADTVSVETAGQQNVQVNGTRVLLKSPSGTNTTVRLQHQGNSGYGDIILDRTVNAFIIDNDPSNASNNTSYFAVKNKGTENLRIDSSGRLLVGHTATDDRDGYNSALQVSGTGGDDASVCIGRWSANTSAPGLAFSKSRNGTIGSHTAVAANDILGMVQFQGDDGTNYHVGADIRAKVVSGVGNDDMPTDLIFSTNAGSTGPTENFRITAAGKVGIGTDNPQGSLHVLRGHEGFRLERDASNPGYYDIAISSGTPVGANNHGSAYFTLSNTAGDYVWKSASNERMRLLGDSGNLGIGDDNPSQLLTISHAANTTNGILIKNTNNSQGSAIAQLELSGGDNAHARVQFECNGKYSTIRHDGNGHLAFYTNGSNERFRIDSDGRVIIGDVDNANAHANADDLIIGNTGNDERSGITIVSDTDKDGAIHFSDGAGAGQLRGQIVYGHTWGSYNDVLVMYTAGSKSLHIQDDGDVILGEIGGTTYTEGSTEAQLRVVGDADAGRPGAISLMGFGNTSNEAHARINFQQQTTGTNGQTTARIEAINRSSAEDASDLVFYTEKAGADLKKNLELTHKGCALFHKNTTGEGTATNLSFDSLYLGIGENEGGINVYRTIGLGYRANATSEYPSSIGCQITDWGGHTKAELVFATRNSTGQADVATERMRIKADGQVQISNSSPPASGALFVSDDGSGTALTSGTTLRVANNGSSGSYAVTEMQSGSTSWELRNSGNLIHKFAGRQGQVIGSTDGSGAYILLDGAEGNPISSGTDYMYMEHTSNGQFEMWNGNGSASTSKFFNATKEGYVTKQKQPYFHVQGSPSITNSPYDNGLKSFASISVNNGSHYDNSTGIFTVPVAGFYFFSAGVWSSNGDANNGTNYALLYKRNSSGGGDVQFAGANHHDAWGQLTMASGFYCATGDKIYVYYNGSIQGSTPRNYFSGCLLA